MNKRIRELIAILSRFLPPDYADGIAAPRASVTGIVHIFFIKAVSNFLSITYVLVIL